MGWRPSLVGWRPSRSRRPSLVGWRPSLSGWRPSLVSVFEVGIPNLPPLAGVDRVAGLLPWSDRSTVVAS